MFFLIRGGNKVFLTIDEIYAMKSKVVIKYLVWFGLYSKIDNLS